MIRPFGAGDLSSVLAVRGTTTRPGRAATRRYVRHGELAPIVLAELDQPPYGDRALVLTATGELIGIAGLVPSLCPFDQLRPEDGERRPIRPAALYRPEVGLFYHVHPDHRRRGYATEASKALIEFAFGRLQLAQIVATTERHNLASQAVMRHLGMRLYENSRKEPHWFQTVGILLNPSTSN